MHASAEFGVLDGWNRMHDAPNVVVADSSCFTTGPEKNPTLTAMAIAARAADQLATDLQEGAEVTASRQPRVSVVIPTFNAEAYVRATLDSVVAQTFEDWELVVFDDGSTDGTVDVATSVASGDDRVLVLRGANEGVAAARNRGFAATDPTTEFLIFLDNDDLWHPELLATLVAMLDEHPAHVSAHAVANSISTDGTRPDGDDLAETLRQRQAVRGSTVVELEASEPTTFAAVGYVNKVLTPGLHLVRRAVLQRIGGFDPATVPCDDWDMAVRVSRVGDIGYCDRALLQWRRHGEAQSYRSPAWRKAYFRVRRKMIADPSNSPEQARAARASARADCRNILHGGRAALTDHDYVGAGKQVAKAANAYASYLAALASGRSVAIGPIGPPRRRAQVRVKNAARCDRESSAEPTPAAASARVSVVLEGPGAGDHAADVVGAEVRVDGQPDQA